MAVSFAPVALQIGHSASVCFVTSASTFGLIIVENVGWRNF